jgi:hypothetical protein
MIKNSLLIFLFLTLSTTGCYSQNQQLISPQPQVSDPYTWDFGRVKEGEVLTHTFIFKNESAKTINIIDVNTSCGCTVSKTQKKTLLPDEETRIEVQFKSKGYSGPVQQFVYVHSDNLDNPIIRFIIKAEVLK